MSYIDCMRRHGAIDEAGIQDGLERFRNAPRSRTISHGRACPACGAAVSTGGTATSSDCSHTVTSGTLTNLQCAGCRDDQPLVEISAIVSEVNACIIPVDRDATTGVEPAGVPNLSGNAPQFNALRQESRRGRVGAR